MLFVWNGINKTGVRLRWSRRRYVSKELCGNRGSLLVDRCSRMKASEPAKADPEARHGPACAREPPFTPDEKMPMRRIMIIGSAGSGKSMLARRLGAHLDLPVIHMDREVYWLAGWVQREATDRVAQVERIVAEDAWVFEGSYSSTYRLRQRRADLLIWLDPPLALRVYRVIRRCFRQRGQVRPDLAEGCTEQLRMLPGFLWFILSTHRASRRKAHSFFESTRLPKHRLASVAEVEVFFGSMSATSTSAEG